MTDVVSRCWAGNHFHTSVTCHRVASAPSVPLQIHCLQPLNDVSSRLWKSVSAATPWVKLIHNACVGVWCFIRNFPDQLVLRLAWAVCDVCSIRTAIKRRRSLLEDLILLATRMSCCTGEGRCIAGFVVACGLTGVTPTF